MKKYIYIFAGVVVVGAVGALLYSFVFKGGGVSNNLPSDTGSVSRIHPVDSGAFPTGGKVTIGTAHGSIAVNNFYKLVSQQEDDALLIKKTNEYLISYDTTNSSFWIFITASPMDTVEKAAEGDLLAILGVSQSQVCSLNVAWGVAANVNKALSGASYPLSFCSAAVPGVQ